MNILEFFSVASSIILAASVLLIAMLYYKANRERRYDEVNKKIELDKLRESYESKIYELMERLISTESRWKDVNHLLLSAQNSGINLSRERVDFLKVNGITPEDTVIDKELVFILTPYHNKYNDTYKTISDVCSSLGLKPTRGDEMHVSGDILSHTLNLMTKARIIIANIDGRNPNVFYELGIAHALNKSVILVSSSLNDTPVDIKSNRIILHSSESDLRINLSNSLAKVLVHSV